MNHIRLRPGLPDDPITPGDLTTCRNRTVTPDADPQHPQLAESQPCA